MNTNTNNQLKDYESETPNLLNINAFYSDFSILRPYTLSSDDFYRHNYENDNLENISAWEVTMNSDSANVSTRLTQGNFAFLPDLTDDQIKKQIQYGLKQKFAISIEYTDDPHPRNSYWEMWGLPLFDIPDASAIMAELKTCRKVYPNMYIKINGFNNTRGVESTSMSFIVNRPSVESGFYLTRNEGKGRNIQYTLNSYAVQGNLEHSTSRFKI